MKLAAIFQDHAVLQRGCPVPVFGFAAPRTAVVVRYRGQCVSAPVSVIGEFCAWLAPMEAGEGAELVVQNHHTGEKVTQRDIAVGEVWLAGGQSNMEFRMLRTPEQLAQYQENPSKRVRYFKVAKSAEGCRQRDTEGCWQFADAEHCAECSAVALWFARRLAEELRVTVGVVNCAWSGSIVEAWTSAETLSRNPLMAERLAQYRDAFQDFDPAYFYRPLSEAPVDAPIRERFAVRAPEVTVADTEQWYAPDFDDSAWAECDMPGSWIAQGIAGNGVVVFRCGVALPESWLGAPLELHLGGIDKSDVTFFNGRQVGATGGGLDGSHWEEKRCYCVPAEQNDRRMATVAVRAYSYLFDGGFNGEAQDYRMVRIDTGEVLPLPRRWKAKAAFDGGRPKINAPQYPLPRYLNCPGILFDGMIAPLLPCALRGVIFYQGCTNAQFPQACDGYERKLRDLVADWRWHFRQPSLPFYLVQLANYAVTGTDNQERVAMVRDAQRRVADAVENCAMVSAIDLGNDGDLHPKDKRSVGERLAELALGKCYNLIDRKEFPSVAEWACEGEIVRMRFRGCARGLRWKGMPGGVELSGDQTQWVPAEEYRLEQDTLTVRSSRVPRPVAVRYCWSDNPVATLYNGDGLPVPAFLLP